MLSVETVRAHGCLVRRLPGAACSTYELDILGRRWRAVVDDLRGFVAALIDLETGARWLHPFQVLSFELDAIAAGRRQN